MLKELNLNSKGVVSMRAWIDRDGCISCGLCPTICPEVFRMADDGLAEVYVDEVSRISRIQLRKQQKVARSVIHIED